MIDAVRSCLAAGALFASFGCGTAAGVQHDRAAQRMLAAVHGVASTSVLGGPVVVAILRASDIQGTPLEVVDYAVLDADGGTFDFVLPPGRYHLAAFDDANRDLAYQPNERVAAWNDFAPFELDVGQALTGCQLRVTRPDPRGTTVELEDPSGESRSLFVGDVLPLDAERFDPSTGPLGMLQPLQFMETLGSGVFLLEAHREGRIPVIFVHGISGHPREFSAMVERLDRERFEPWVIQYASGFDLGRVTSYIERGLAEAVLVHRIARFCVVAHSMGGVVSRSALARYGRRSDQADVPLFITIASPLGGHPAAGMGATFSPVVLPVWQSLVPSGAFIQTLHDLALRPATRYELLFAYGSPDMSGDGVVPLWSQLRPEAQTEAALVRGFRESHTGILHADATLDHITHALADHCR